MANLFDYLDWRGDLTLEQAEFNEVDSLVLCWMSYVALDGIVPTECSEERALTIKEVADKFFATHDLDRILKSTISFTKTSVLLLQKMAESKRFQNIRLTGFTNQIDYAQETQFCAMTVLLEKGLNYVLYRGTDDTLIGWKEDFNMSFLPVIPAQHMALAYLEGAAEKIRGKLLVGGHSKGGNLAIFAGVRSSAKVRRRILRIYNNDGPGFSDIGTLGDAYAEMLPRIETYVPESSVIGLLLERNGDYTVVKSSSIGLLQHDAMTWEILGGSFVTVEELSQASILVDQILKNWLKEISKEEREIFVDTLFRILETTKAKNIDDLSVEKAKAAHMVLKEVTGLDKQTKMMLAKTISALFKEGNLVIKGLNPVTPGKKK